MFSYSRIPVLVIGMLLFLSSCQKDSELTDAFDNLSNGISLAAFPVMATITHFTPATGNFYPGYRVSSNLVFKNSGRKRWTFWVGYSVQDQSGIWYDVPSNPVSLYPGQSSTLQNKTWIVPPDPKVTSGAYNVRMAIWSAKPEDGVAIRLAYMDKAAAFNAFNFSDHFNLFDTSRWLKGNHKTPGTTERPGLGSFQTKNVTIDSGRLLLKHPANTKNGGEIQSISPYQYSFGTFRTTMKCPSLPGTITTLFTYQGVDYGDEIDLEIWNDGSGKVIFTVWKYETSKLTGQSVYNNTILMGFDPSLGFHEYRIDFYPDQISWHIDGVQKDKFTDRSNFPAHPMYLYVNTWWPNWPGWEKYNSDSVDRFAEYHVIAH